MSVARKPEPKGANPTRGIRISDDTWEAWGIWLRVQGISPEEALLRQMRDHPISMDALPRGLKFEDEKEIQVSNKKKR